jgi:hypothetical protein
MELIIAPTDNAYRQQENLALQEFYQDVALACESCHSVNTMETKYLPEDSPHHKEIAPKPVAADYDNTHYKVACSDCGQVTRGVLPDRFSAENGWITETIWDVHAGDVVVGWGLIADIRRSADCMAYIVTTENGFTFDYPDGDDVIVKHRKECAPPSDEDQRPLGYTELRERMLQVLAETGDKTIAWPDNGTNPPYFQDGSPLALLGCVLAGLGVYPTRLGGLTHYNDRHPVRTFPAAGFALTEQAAQAAGTVWALEMREHPWSECIEEALPDPHHVPVPEDLTSLTKAKAARCQQVRTAPEPTTTNVSREKTDD